MNFLHNKYTLLYFQIIKNRQEKEFIGYTENHHIIPKSLNGTNEISNLVKLSAREHFICHLLLPKMVSGYHRQLMQSALGFMVRSTDSRIKRYAPRSSILYAIARQACITSHSSETKKKISETLKKYYEENPERKEIISKKMSIVHKGISKSAITRSRMSIFQQGRPKSEEQKIKLRKAAINQPVKTCPHCGFSGTSTIIYRWHFDRCKMKPTDLQIDLVHNQKSDSSCF